MTTLYLAAASCLAERERLMRWVAALDKRGVALATRWWDGLDPNRALSRPEQEAVAQHDLDAIRSADVVWCLHPEHPHTGGSLVELGYSIAVHGPDRCIVSGSTAADNVFAALCTRLPTDEAGFAYVLRTLEIRTSQLSWVP